MSNTYEKLVNAGAPAIVEPLFYRVSENSVNGSIIVEVRERLPYKGSNLKARRIVSSRRPAELLENVVEAMTEAVEEMEFKTGLASLTGEHSSADA
ncbi:hypothetical protein SEA_VRESIDENCE_45 [Arthrobacter phage VResidence]|uniref:Uncharacterized protein n=1 Tax=Arthrobacter phage VResidence TaxID=2927294 RepID=A0A9X9K3R7_9CAUD|nr:hypothetical protein SEA_VRESIDENCE_45 [Arthrobacter phage VResidence]